MKLKIAIVVHGRFHAFDLARELINQGHNVTLFTNYPKKIAEKFGIPQKNVQTFLLHGLLTRVIYKLHGVVGTPNFEAFLHSAFSQWAARIINKSEYDIVHVFSGVAEEIFQALSTKRVLKSLMRGSAHILTQSRLLSEEEQQAGISVDRPSNWMIAREEREYQLADVILVLSSFAQQSFNEQNISLDKLRILPLGAQIDKFRPVEEVIQERCQRILAKQPLHVLMVGNFSYRKGANDFVKIAELASISYQFKFVGTVTSEASELAEKNSKNIEFIAKQPQFELSKFYAWADIFIFTTIEDGYAMVLAQAQAAGLPILATTNCSGPDIILEGQTGWVLPIRSSKSFVERLKWCNEHRQELAQMVWRVYENFQPRDWAEVATDFVSIHTGLLK
ncbi:glycosyltransferase [Nostoc sp. 'Peltigera membranacea cyanobiont' 213]|uniref:glycosyltransferase family 4 protein n=1 Tax=Nostoc sp. 'Peltigera membranacea cyanobiont' 213 TaxID=2014530 RepID=UPI000B95A587|nr:glycosyltransferase family 4 protein [Nostoc sp. 'Peltigera membranacea cyanobiont' 213]OYD99143.1 glycosyltransferase [Nostoc sp. 'Peltigera membranacea cyanobiont' 213]